MRFKIVFSLIFATLLFTYSSLNCFASDSPKPKQSDTFRPQGQYFLKADGTPRTVAIFLYNGVTAQDFVGVYTILSFASGNDLNFKFVAKEKGQIKDDKGRLAFYADSSIDEVDKADILIVPGGFHFGVLNDKESLTWIKKIYDSAEYVVSVCTGSHILGAAGATTGKRAGIAWFVKEFLAPVGMTYVPTPPISVDGKYYSGAGVASGIEIGLKLIEVITGSRNLAAAIEFGAEWNPHMLYGSGDPQKTPRDVIKFLIDYLKSDPKIKDLPVPKY